MGSYSSTAQKDNRIDAGVASTVNQIQYDSSGNLTANNYFSQEVKEAMQSVLSLADKAITGTLSTHEKLAELTTGITDVLASENKSLTGQLPSQANYEKWPLLVMLAIFAFMFFKGLK